MSHSKKTEQIEHLSGNDPFWDALTELLPVCLFAKDLEGRYLYVNESFAAKSKLRDKAAIIGKMPSEVLAPEDAAFAEAEDRSVIETGEPIINRENRNRGRHGDQNYEIISKICVRDEAGNKLGLVGTTLDITERKHNENKLHELNAKLEAQNRRYEEELTLGRQVQKTFVKVKADDSGELLDLGYHYQPSTKLSGDLIIAEPIDDTRWAILICDVMGHGIRSALVTGILRSFYDEHKERMSDPAAFVTELNQHYKALLQGLDTALFTTLTCGVLNLLSGEMTLCSAGHHDPIWFRTRAGEFVAPEGRILTRNPAIGLLDDHRFRADTHTLEDGDSILFYTDGLIEACSADGEEFGVDPIRQLIQTHAADLPSQALIDTLVAQVHAFADEIDDDISLLLLKKL
ncbi:SpoIIE family protein phosphatase [Coraliomargarita parva]|uniref:SpoIIE family protein phosphatase n=1 Tax=Coraliomargarita parva TaxID=3014050 RepID=UPI0022B30C8A|nr:SpoIIE family protein phosphatase [Coraliomargarita parva]